MASADIPRMYREVQLLVALRAEKEKNLALRRQALQELKNEAAAAVDELNSRKQSVMDQRGEFDKASAAFQAAQEQRAAAVNHQLQQIASYESEAMNQHRRCEQLIAETKEYSQKIQQLKQDEANASRVDEMIAKLTHHLQQKEHEFHEYQQRIVGYEAKSRSRWESAQLEGLPCSP